MEVLSNVLSTQYLFPASAVALVLVCVVLVFVFGFKTANQPQFEKLSPGEDRKQAGKKRKTKDKKSLSNGHATSASDSDTGKASEVRVASTKKSPVKEKQQPKEQQNASNNKQQQQQQSKENNKKSEKASEPKAEKKSANAVAKTKARDVVEVKNKKNKQPEEKPLDFDDGNWETVPTKTDKKNRKNNEETTKKEGSPKKNQKKSKQTGPPPPATPDSNIDQLDNKKLDEVTKDMKEKVNEQQKAAGVEKKLDVVLTPVEIEDEIIAEVKTEEPVAVVAAVVKDNKKKSKDKKSATVETAAAKTEQPKKETAGKKDGGKKEAKKEQQQQQAVKEEKKEEVAVKSPATATSDKASEAAQFQPVAFDELGDVWTEAKNLKKTKKKARKE